MVYWKSEKFNLILFVFSVFLYHFFAIARDNIMHEILNLQYSICALVSHTASTAAGNHQVPVIVNGFNYGNASGMAPGARYERGKIKKDY